MGGAGLRSELFGGGAGEEMVTSEDHVSNDVMQKVFTYNYSYRELTF